MASIRSITCNEMKNSVFTTFNTSSSRRTAPCYINPRSENGAVRSTNLSPHRIATRKRLPRISATATNSSVLAPCHADKRPENDGVLFSDTLDEWMRDSTVEIVRNLRKAPLLVQIHASGADGSAEKVEAERAVEEEWPAVARRWKEGDAPSPDGVILVEELAGDGEGEGEGEGEEEGTRAWGMVVQGKGKGKGAKCGPVCYLMKTCRVGSGLGFCTHFCLMKVDGFRESAPSQLKNCWLLR